MERNFYNEAMAKISGHFRKPYRDCDIDAIWPVVQDLPAGSLVKTYQRVTTDYHPDALTPIGKIRDIIVQEGRKILEQASIERENEDRRQRKEEMKSLPSGHDEHSRECCSFLGKVFSGKFTTAELLHMAEEGDKRFPGRGFKPWRDKLEKMGGMDKPWRAVSEVLQPGQREAVRHG